MVHRLRIAATHPKREHAIRLETAIDARQLLKAANEQSGASEQDNGHCHLSDDEDGMRRYAGGHQRPPRRDERGGTTSAARPKSRQTAANDRHAQNRRQRIHEDAPVDRDLVKPRQIRCGCTKDMDFDAEYARRLSDVARDIEEGAARHIAFTPSVFINGRSINDARGNAPSPEALDRMIQELGSGAR